MAALSWIAVASAPASTSRATHTHDCHNAAAGVKKARLVFTVTSAERTTCHAAVTVLRYVSTWADPDRYYGTLGAFKHTNNYGYRCHVDLVADSYWKIRCARGTRLIRGYTAE